jgi:hypothetical protein
MSELEDNMIEALSGLFLEIPEDVVDDVQRKVFAYTAKLQAELATAVDALRRIAYSPIGGKSEDYFCSVRLQTIAREALKLSGVTDEGDCNA